MSTAAKLEPRVLVLGLFIVLCCLFVIGTDDFWPKTVLFGLVLVQFGIFSFEVIQLLAEKADK